MEIKIVSAEIIKPSSPTPHHLRTHNLFCPNDGEYPHIYFSVTLFYSAAETENGIKLISSHLKNSLSKTLTYYYPFAGQTKNGVYTNCNDHGAPFIETQVAKEMSMSEVLQKKDIHMLKMLLPLNGNLQEIQTTYDIANIVVQVNYFSCGGIAISVCFNHTIADATAAANFIKIWAEVACGSDDIKNVIVDYSSIYPPYDSRASLVDLYEQNAFFPISTETVTKMFKFNGKSIAALRDKISNGPFLDRPTRFEAISTLISSAIINTTAERDELTAAAATQLAVVIAINLRNKLNPPLPPQCIGNLIATTIAKLPFEKKESDDYNNYLAGKLHESIRKVIGQYKTNVHEGDAVIEGLSKSKIFHITDWCKLPFNEADFGWGKPTWVAPSGSLLSTAVLMDTCNGGVEAWIGLPKDEDMAKFQAQPEIIAYASFN